MKVTLAPAQIAPEGLAPMETLTEFDGFTVMLMAFDVAGLPVGQEMFDVNIQVTISPFAKELLE